jgi:tRNA-dihydrouridine synthase
MFTEFIPTEGLYRGRITLLHALDRHTSKTPVYAQFFGGKPEFYSYAFFVAAELGFTGIDVNMGCPDTNIVHKGGGAGLLLDLPRAQRIVRELVHARTEWTNGKRLKDTDLPESMKDAVENMAKISEFFTVRGSMGGSPRVKNNDIEPLSISVKTRIGYHTSQVTEVIPALIEAGVERIELHGRTFDQRYSGLANWDEIAKAKELTRGTPVPLWGNGDLHSLAEAREHIKQYKVDGALIARAAFGNPWLFAERMPTDEERIQTMLAHSKLYLQYRPEMDLRPMRKHLAWYCKGMEGSAKLREQLMKVITIEDLQKILA